MTTYPFLLPNETVLESFTATARISVGPRMDTTVCATSHRLLIISPHDPTAPWWRWWGSFTAAELRNSAFTGHVAFTLPAPTSDGSDELDPRVAALTAAMSDVVIDCSKKRARSLADLFTTYRNAAPPRFSGRARITVGSTDVYCDSCGSRSVGDDLTSCSACSRTLTYPEPVNRFVTALTNPRGTLPDRFDNGKETGSALALSFTTKLALAAYVTSDADLTGMLVRWLDSVQSRTPVPASDFPDLPPLADMFDGDQRNLDGMWSLIRQFPEWLEPGGGPEREFVAHR